VVEAHRDLVDAVTLQGLHDDDVASDGLFCQSIEPSQMEDELQRLEVGGSFMKIGKSLTAFGLFAALTAGEALASTPQITPAVMVSGPGMREPATVQDVVYRRRRYVRTRRYYARGYYARPRSKKKSAAIVAGSAAGGAAIGALAGGGKGAGIGAIAGGGAGLLYDQATRNKRR
jgi:hypothetical protein